MIITKKVLGERITSFRRMKGLSQEELAFNIDLSRSALAKIEMGQRTVSALELNAIGNVLGFSLNEILAADFEVGPNETERASKEIETTPYPLKLRTVLLYVLERCAGKSNVGETVLYKMLYLSDFDYYELYQKYLTGMKYRKLSYGPVPLRIEHFINSMIERNDLRRIKCRYQSYLQTRYVPLRQPDHTLLDAAERKVIDRVIDQFSDMSAAAISVWSHHDQPWLLSKNGEEIDYAYALLRQAPYSVARSAS